MKNINKKAIVAIIASVLTSAPALAEEAVAQAAATGITDKGLFAIAGALALGLAAFGGAFGQAKAASAALDGIARNPAAQGKIFIPMLLSLAFIESLVIYALLIALRINV